MSPKRVLRAKVSYDRSRRVIIFKPQVLVDSLDEARPEVTFTEEFLLSVGKHPLDDAAEITRLQDRLDDVVSHLRARAQTEAVTRDRTAGRAFESHEERDRSLAAGAKHDLCIELASYFEALP